MNRALGVAKMQLINKWTFLGIPALILVSTFAMTMAIWAMLPDSAAEGVKYSGAGQAIMWYFFGLGIQSLTLSFPFSQGLSISRRNFFLGTVGLFTVVAAVVAGLYVVLGVIETATQGWGLNGRMFALQWVADQPWFIQIFFYFILMMFLFLLGFWSATLYKRWQATGLLVTGIVLAVVIVAMIALITVLDGWTGVGSWILTLTPATTGLIALALSAALGLGAFLTLRRATP
ncbi:hypothetical protein SAMN04489740_0350 [Arthrobacter alpinus]|uniref:Uncharacterized protein n=1 Tax=Arthrobacter alpinus TaxID=656366 RepID=A0A1H5EVI8_9MICC|nr:hypothetical protein [Arthrobacter alpinus]SED95121.1 hypothetical protein SAMN04489740_0350 [Arthrobacter alpinus]